MQARKKRLSPDEVDFGAPLVAPEPDVLLKEETKDAAKEESEVEVQAFASEEAPTDEQATKEVEPEPESDVLLKEEAKDAAQEEVEVEVQAFASEEASTDEQATKEPEPESDALEEETEVASAPAVMVPTVTQATIEDVHALIEGLRKEAREAGYRAGMEEGLAKGLEEGQTKGYEEGLAKGLEEGTKRGEKEGFEKGYSEGKFEGEAYARTLKATATGFAADVARANEVIAGDVLALALDFAKAMMKTALKVKPELLVPVVADAVHYLPSLQQPAVLYLNPEDAVIVRKAMGDELEKAGMRLAEEDVPRGSCRIETGSNQIDGSLATRWQRLAGSLGRESDWME